MTTTLSSSPGQHQCQCHPHHPGLCILEAAHAMLGIMGQVIEEEAIPTTLMPPTQKVDDIHICSYTTTLSTPHTPPTQHKSPESSPPHHPQMILTCLFDVCLPTGGP
ncbi:hypothetical protein Pelo_10528 [Pelomyxa schiedti]|nr:hypothetical protein Pelo_10528 [Pelomyxa schiedti]